MVYDSEKTLLSLTIGLSSSRSVCFALPFKVRACNNQTPIDIDSLAQKDVLNQLHRLSVIITLSEKEH